jgi:hypothetical protein
MSNSTRGAPGPAAAISRFANKIGESAVRRGRAAANAGANGSIAPAASS